MLGLRRGHVDDLLNMTPGAAYANGHFEHRKDAIERWRGMLAAEAPLLRDATGSR
jgi:hypothetical protein